MRRPRPARRDARTSLVVVVALALAAAVVAVAVWNRVDPGAAAAEPSAPPPIPAPAASGQADEAAAAPAPDAGHRESARVARVVDGDTIVLDTGATVRLVQIDAPEVRGAECYANEATAALTTLIPPGTEVTVEADPVLDQVDRYGRQLAYVVAGGNNVNVALVRDGAASVWFYGGARGRHAGELLGAAEDARGSGRGLWGACEADLDPLRAVTTSHRGGAAAPASAAPAIPAAADGCHPAYDPCLPIVDDLDCAHVRALGAAPVTVGVRGTDPYRLDRDRDGSGCE